MAGSTNPIRLSGHARQQMQFRGAAEQEISDTIRTSPWQQVQRGRFEARKDFAFAALWNGTNYQNKQVRPIFVEEQDEIVVVTVYVYYY